MARATLKLKSPPDPAPPHAPRRGKKTVIIDKLAAARPHRQVVAFKERRVEYSELFAFKPQSIGERIAIIRAWFELEGLPEVPEEAGIATFATVAMRFLCPRYAWQVFETRREAESFIREWAAKLLPLVVAHGPAKTGNAQSSWMLPEYAAFYDPSIVKARFA